MNLVRQQVSDLKGGGMLRHCSHPVTALILSDVVGDDLSTIASGPTAPPLGTSAQAIAVLRNAGIWETVPVAVRSHLETASGPLALPIAHNILVGSNSQSVAAMTSTQQDITAIQKPVEGDVSAAARLICDQACPGITVWGGETTVQISGTGKGGRNQELALRIACEAARRGWGNFACLVGGTDGRDGPVDAAGGVVDARTLTRVVAAGGDIDALLANNDSYAALGLAGDLLMTGATGTNVADLGVLIRR
jgi:glycerate 2-kinase